MWPRNHYADHNGTSLSIVSEEIYDDLINYGLNSPTEGTPALLRTYSGEYLPVWGKIRVAVSVDSQRVVFSLIVIKGKGPTLMLLDWLSKLKLNWMKVHQLSSSDKLQDFLTKYSSVFRKVENFERKINGSDGPVSKFYKTRNVPCRVGAMLEQELRHLEENNINIPIQFLEWATPMVPVVKQNGSIRVCEDYKLIVNQMSHVDC